MLTSFCVHSPGPFWGTNSPCCTDSQQWGSLEPGSKAAGGGPRQVLALSAPLPYTVSSSVTLPLLMFSLPRTSLYDTVWVPVIQKKVPAKLQWSGPASINGGTLS